VDVDLPSRTPPPGHGPTVGGVEPRLGVVETVERVRRDAHRAVAGFEGRQARDAEAGSAEIIYTDPDDAVTFVEQTGVDSLAVAIGTSARIRE
jgi:fructose/tagatose bisphosphate aldolase